MKLDAIKKLNAALDHYRDAYTATYDALDAIDFEDLTSTAKAARAKLRAIVSGNANENIRDALLYIKLDLER